MGRADDMRDEETIRTGIMMTRIKFVANGAKATPFQRETLDNLNEECAEVIQRATKMSRFRVNEVQHDQPHDNAYRLGLEVGNLLAAIGLAAEAGLINLEAIAIGIEEKQRKIPIYFQTWGQRKFVPDAHAAGWPAREGENHARTRRAKGTQGWAKGDAAPGASREVWAIFRPLLASGLLDPCKTDDR